MRLLLDAMFAPVVASTLNRSGHDVERVADLLQPGAKDVLVFAVLEEGSFDALVTLDKHGKEKPEDRDAALYAMSSGARIAEVRLPVGQNRIEEQIETLILHLDDIRLLIAPDSLVRRIRLGLSAGVQRTDTLYDILNEIHRLGSGD